MRGRIVLAGLMLVMAAPAAAQARGDGPRAAQLRAMIEDRLLQQAVTTMGLSGDNANRFKQTVRDWAQRRQGLELQERQLREAMEMQLRPGVAADADSLGRLTTALVDTKVAIAQSYRDELRALAFLTPVQRGQFVLMRERLLQRAREVRAQLRERMLQGGGADAAP